MNTYWFYENSRGKWDELRRHESTQAKRRIYDSKFPKQQRFDKGMFAKVWYSHLGKPEIVSKGPQKCFAFFQQDYLSNLDDDEDLDVFFKKTIALLMMWKHIEGESKKKVRQGIYQSFTQNITAYALAMFSFKNPTFDLHDYLWEKQEVGKDLAEYLEILTDKAHDHITDLPPGLNLVPEFAKKEECWKNFKAASHRIPELSNLATIKMRNEYSTYSKASSGGLNQVQSEDVIYCMELPGPLWTNLAHRIDFFRGTLRESSKEVSQCNSMAELINTKKIPSDTLAKACRTIHERALEDGWKL